MVGAPPIGIVIGGKVQLYKRKHGTESCGYEWDMPLPFTEWPHPALRMTVMEASAQTTYPTEIYADGSKVGARLVLCWPYILTSGW